MSDPAVALELADLLFSSIMRGDIDTLRDRVYSASLVVWHNNDGVEQNIEQNLRTLTWVVANVSNVRYEDVRRQPTPTGFVQQHVLRGTTPNGEQLEVPACLVVRIDGGRIERIDEYLDSASVRPLLSPRPEG